MHVRGFYLHRKNGREREACCSAKLDFNNEQWYQSRATLRLAGVVDDFCGADSIDALRIKRAPLATARDVS